MEGPGEAKGADGTAPQTGNVHHVEVVPMLSDNYSYLLWDPLTREGAAIDPVEPKKIIAKADEVGVRITHVLTTHGHWDHCGGNEEIAKLIPGIEIIGGVGDNIPAVTREVKEGDIISIGSLSVHTVETPCHTPGHVCFILAGAPGSAFTGDTLFVGGSGNLNSGTAAQMYDALRKLMELPKDTQLWVGHEYTKRNLRFASFAEPGNQAITGKLKWACACACTVPTTVISEMDTNPFVRAKDAAALKAVRESKDDWGRSN